jgi:hypothetical protein
VGQDSLELRWVSSNEPVSGILISLHVCHALEKDKRQNRIKNEDRKRKRKMCNDKEKEEKAPK